MDLDKIKARFWSAVEKTSHCWKWNGSKSLGYGQIYSMPRCTPFKAHRISWIIHNGPIPDGMHVLHKCDNPECSRPDHLFLGTHKDNMTDAVKKGRMKVEGKAHYGADNKSSKLDMEKVRMIRQSIGSKSLTEIARVFKVHRTTISNIRDGKIWKEQLHA